MKNEKEKYQLIGARIKDVRQKRACLKKTRRRCGFDFCNINISN